MRGIWLAVRFLRLALCAALLAGFVFATGADAQTFFYNEVAKDGRIYVFAVGDETLGVHQEQRCRHRPGH